MWSGIYWDGFFVLLFCRWVFEVVFIGNGELWWVVWVGIVILYLNYFNDVFVCWWVICWYDLRCGKWVRVAYLFS